MDIAELRREYHHAQLTENEVDRDPVRQFERWLADAVKAELPEPTAMALATADAEGRPSARIVLLKAVDAEGFVFFTNYQSRKGLELAVRADAALLFHWCELERQVRIEGRVAPTEAQVSDAYFASRPRMSRLGALASPQSRVVSGREWLEQELERVARRYGEGDAVPRPGHWGGYRLAPHTIEFWQGRASRLHDRVRYTLEEGAWRIERLAP